MTIPLFRWKQRSGASPGERFRFPLPFTGRIALVDAAVPASGNVRRFSSDDLRALLDFLPEALVAPLDPALSLADLRLRGLLDLGSLSVAIVVFTGVEDSPLADHHRDLLWRAFGVPVFEQLRARNGAIVARECEVHDGLHISVADAAKIGEAVTTDQCECGEDTPRLRSLSLNHHPNNFSALRPRIFSRSASEA